MLKEINTYTQEIIIGRVAKIEKTDTGIIRLGIIDNYDEKGEAVEAKWINVSASDKTAATLDTLNNKGLMKGAILVAGLNKRINGEYTNRYINWFKIVQFPKSKE